MHARSAGMPASANRCRQSSAAKARATETGPSCRAMGFTGRNRVAYFMKK